MSALRLPLVVMADDDEADCVLAKDAFEESGSRGEFVCVEDGVELLDYLHNVSLPDLILLDLNMPVKDGRQALKEIKENAKFQNIPVVVFTTSQQEVDKAFSRQMGANSFVTKPSKFGQWIEIMKSLSDEWLKDKTRP